MSGLEIRAAWRPLEEAHVEALGGHMGVYEVAAASGETVLIGYAGGRSVFGLRGELREQLAAVPHPGASFRCEITTAYLSRYKELLMLHAAKHGSLPVMNRSCAPALGRLSPS